MRELVNCKKVECDYYRKYNGIQRTVVDTYMTDFVTIDERCSHPESMLKEPRTRHDPGGVRLIMLNKCPNGN